MKKIIRSIAPFALVFALGITAYVFTQTRSNDNLAQRAGRDGRRGHGGPGGPGGRAGIHPRMFEQLGLSDEQNTQIKQLLDAGRTSAEESFAKIKTADEQNRALAEQDTFNEDQARQLIAAKKSVESEIELARLRTDNAVYNLLTAEQKAKFKELRTSRPQPPLDGAPRRNRPSDQN